MPAGGASRDPGFQAVIDWQPLRLLTTYRLALASLLIALYFALMDSNPFNVELSGLFETTLFAYLLFGVAAGLAARARWPGYELQALVQVLADIAAIALLLHATGGVASALSVLLVVAVVFGTLVLPGRLAYLFAAVATLAVLIETGITSLLPDTAGAGAVTRAGLVGAVLFMAAGLTHLLVVRARESAALAARRGVDLANLEQLNRYIVQQLESGLLVIDQHQYVHLANDYARRLLNLNDDRPQRLEHAAPRLAEQFRNWAADHQWQPQPIQSSDASTSLIPRFSALTTSEGRGALILLDDSVRLAQQSQQLKLASLGRLTASIAHEIRNPLGAISHAAQLLGESDQLTSADQRLTGIIERHTRRVNTIIEDVLQLSRGSASHPQRLQLDQWLPTFREDFTQSRGIDHAHLELDIASSPLALQVDPGHLHQVLTNLCENALRHCPDRDAPVVLHAWQDDHGAVVVEVVDKGPGIDPDTAEKMFEPFFTTAASGTGLGLYIARELCELNQARLSYRPDPDGGSRFRIQFSQSAA
jgi:two-component system sensor histidine kinase PilS (NtrC family)